MPAAMFSDTLASRGVTTIGSRLVGEEDGLEVAFDSDRGGPGRAEVYRPRVWGLPS